MPWRDPGSTTNPWNVAHTPDGFRSGSAAGVADGMCLAALGSQTAGSVLRPTAYNGGVGFKLSYGALSVQRVVPLNKSLDDMGMFTRTVINAQALWRVLKSAAPAPVEDDTLQRWLAGLALMLAECDFAENDV